MLSWRSSYRRTSWTLAAAAALAFGVLLPIPAHAAGTEVSDSTPGRIAKPSAPQVGITKTKVPAVAGDTRKFGLGQVVAELPQTSTSRFRMIGVTWSEQGLSYGVKVEVRTRTAGTWSSWTTLDVDDEGEGGVPGTEPMWVGNADGVAARVTSTLGAPQDVRISTLDPGSDATVNASGASYTAPLDGVARASTAATIADGSPTYTPKPTIITRAQWGASAGTPCDSPTVGSTTRGVIMHHTAGSNSYTKSDSAAIVRAAQAYHMKARGWCDIGYNFLVDKYGQIFEGRRGGTDRSVRAAHSGNLAVNTYDMGVSMMGNLDLVRPSAEMQAAVVKLLGWRMGTNYMKAKGTYSLGGLTLNMIAGHRNVISTACPGKYGYQWLTESGGLRDRVEAYISHYTSSIKTRAASLGRTKTGAVYVGEAPTEGGRKTRFANLDVYAKAGAGTRYVTEASGFRTRYGTYGSQTSKLGFPTSDSPTVSSAGVFAQRFQYGSIFAVRTSTSTKTYALWGDIAKLYKNLGEQGGKLGAPTSSVTTVKTGVTRANFAKGYIISTVSAKTVAYTSGGSVITTLTVAVPPPAVSGVLATPTSSSVSLTWTALTGVTGYQACLLATPTSTTCSYSSGVLTSAKTTFAGLAPTSDTDYYAKVRAKNAAGWGAWSSLRGFNLLTGNTLTVPSSREIALTGHGYGHGIGMSQYGAQGAAKLGVTYDKILARYYPGTVLGTKTGSIRVLLSQATSDAVTITGQSGLVFRNVAAKTTMALPTEIGGRRVTRWRILPLTADRTRSTLQYLTTGSYASYKSIHWTGDGQFEGPSSMMLVVPSGSTMKYRGALRSALPSKGAKTRDTVNVVPLKDYVRGVISAEMPSSWMPEALKAQAVAARTYGVRSISPTRYYDICNTTSCQVYGGAAKETAATDAAVNATRDKILTYQGLPAFTQFSSSSGGYTATGTQPYLKAVSDPWDAWSGNANHQWATTITAAKVESAYPAIGRLVRLTITQRSGVGDWGGRVSTLSLVGSTKTVTITGNQARSAFGLKSNWFRF
jgi:SpoIID/LytB domain protein